jgi:hypothetical protein
MSRDHRTLPASQDSKIQFSTKYVKTYFNTRIFNDSLLEKFFKMDLGNLMK